MLSFGTYFFICNFYIAFIIGILFAAKRLFKKQLSGRTRYHLWLVMLIIFMIPFFPFRPGGFPQLFTWLSSLRANTVSPAGTNIQTDTAGTSPSASNWMNDFSISVDTKASSILNDLFLWIWLIGMLAMLLFMIRSRLRLYRLQRSALPLQSKKVQGLFLECHQEMNLRKYIPVYSTAFLKSPILVGFFRPRIYLPIHLIADFDGDSLKYMILHELQHYKHKDPLIKYFTAAAAVFYWFNPMVWYVLKELHQECEVTCDTSVLQMLNVTNYIDYGNTLINFAEKVSFAPFSFVNGMGGSMEQIKRRILNIAAYRPQTKWQKVRSRCIFLLTAILLLESSALLPVHASGDSAALFFAENVSYEDLSSFFQGYEGSFVLYDMNSDTWQVYNQPLAGKRVSPDSTYKMYSALMALEHNIIKPGTTEMSWNGQEYIYPQWNNDQSLSSAMQNSVNWYFQSLDRAAGMEALEEFYTEIGYGNRDLSGGFDFWLESSLKISALEQVALLKKLYTNEFHFEEQNIRAVQNSMKLSVSDTGTLYGKTGTGNINGQNINGWFIGYVETSGNQPYFFAVNLQNSPSASGVTASEIALNILREKNIY